MAHEEGVEEVVIGLTYSISPVHTHEYYLERARAVAASEHLDRLYLKDPGGLLTPDAVRELIPGFIEAVAPRPVELHSHCTISLARSAYMEGLKSGARTLHTAVAPVANGTSNPSCETTLHNLEAEGYSHDLDIEALAEVSNHFRELAERKELPLGAPVEYDAAYYHHQMPGGMVTTTKRHLAEIGKPELFDATLEEVTRVRAEMGYPIMVTPVSQFVATQAVMNVIYEERWSQGLERDGPLLPRPLLRAGRTRRPGDQGQGALAPARRRARQARAAQPGGRPRALRRGDLRRGAAPSPDHARRAGRRDGHRGRRPLMQLDDVKGFVFDVDGSRRSTAGPTFAQSRCPEPSR